jgi:hypothetical protein
MHVLMKKAVLHLTKIILLIRKWNKNLIIFHENSL